MTQGFDALRASVNRLHDVIGGLDPGRLETPAYPSAWTVADVASHLGSGAVILLGRLEDTLAGEETPADAAQVVWDVWDAKTPSEQAADALVADRALLDRLLAMTEDERGRFRFSMGPMTFDLDGAVGFRLNEHALHLWDIEVAFDPTATVAPSSVAVVVDNLDLFTRFTAKPESEGTTVIVTTTGPSRKFVLTTGPDDLSLDVDGGADPADLVLPAEALVRLVYGRLDPCHTPPVTGSVDLDALRRVFPGA